MESFTINTKNAVISNFFIHLGKLKSIPTSFLYQDLKEKYIQIISFIKI